MQSVALVQVPCTANEYDALLKMIKAGSQTPVDMAGAMSALMSLPGGMGGACGKCIISKQSDQKGMFATCMSAEVGAQLMTDLAQNIGPQASAAEAQPTAAPTEEDPNKPPFDRIGMEDDAELQTNGGFGLILGDSRGTSLLAFLSLPLCGLGLRCKLTHASAPHEHGNLSGKWEFAHLKPTDDVQARFSTSKLRDGTTTKLASS